MRDRCAGCGERLDLRHPHVTYTRNIEHVDSTGLEVIVMDSVEIKQLHVECDELTGGGG